MKKIEHLSSPARYPWKLGMSSKTFYFGGLIYLLFIFAYIMLEILLKRRNYGVAVKYML